MKRQLNIKRILVYNDFPELFLGKDNIGLDYICLLVKYDIEEYEYVAVAISKKKLFKFLNGKIDLRHIFENPEVKEWYSIYDTSKRDVTAVLNDYKNLSEEYLPEEGYFYSEETDEDQIRNEVVEQDNVVIHLSLTDDKDDYSIPIQELGDFSKLFQSLLEYTYKKEISNSNLSDKKAFIIPQNYSLRAFASSKGSFSLHLKSESNKDLFGNSIIEKGLKKIDEIISDPSDTELLIEKLRSIKGHAFSNYKKLIERIVDHDIVFKYKWLSPNSSEISKREINLDYAVNVKEILALKEELSEEIKGFAGYVKQADVEKGTWRITNEEDGEDYSGESKGHLLDGITLETKMYKFICEEIIETIKVTEKENVKYILKNVEEV